MKKTALVIMAAGLGSRFGEGLKQLAQVGPSGEIIMDYSIHDALEAGFNKIVFIIRKDIEAAFKEVIGNRIEKIAEVAYVYQELDKLPEGFTKPAERTKPFGTGHAVLCCKGTVEEPFVVINADDYYGKEAFVKVHDFLVQDHSDAEKLQFCMAGFILGNTLSDNGAVTRGLCQVDEAGHLQKVVETGGLVKTAEGAGIEKEDGTVEPTDAGVYASMNMWGFSPEMLDILEENFVEFLQSIPEGDIKKEYLLPSIVDKQIQEGKAEVSVLETKDKWFGVTYKEDKPLVMASFKALVDAGVYKEKLFS
ncbi:MAG: nucleotidyltransferase [Lachnospiraceae bacterium]|nr:nucleotidyltransferase [Lachnospiraceae bacterium]